MHTDARSETFVSKEGYEMNSKLREDSVNQNRETRPKIDILSIVATFVLPQVTRTIVKHSPLSECSVHSIVSGMVLDKYGGF